jgi:hypothetical protein
MAQLLPPPPIASVAAGDDDRRRRLQFRLWQLLMSTITVLVAVWFTSFGKPLVTILAWVIAKHILVAILLFGLDKYPTYHGETTDPQPGR